MDIETYIASAGKFEGTSSWVEINQSQINTFADATDDHQFIHVDEIRAKTEAPFGGTIAHGFLSLSLLTKFAGDCLPAIDNTAMGVNYGLEKVRFLMPVLAGSRVRGHFKLLECAERNPGEYLSKLAVSVEIENQEKPALVAEWLILTFINQQEKT